MDFSKEEFDYVLENSDLKKINQYKESELFYALKYNNEKKLNLTNDQWDYLINNSDLSFIKKEIQLIELKKIQSKLMTDKIEIKEKINKKNLKYKDYILCFFIGLFSLEIFILKK